MSIYKKNIQIIFLLSTYFLIVIKSDTSKTVCYEAITIYLHVNSIEIQSSTPR